jgi:hypothetical protein
VLPSRLILFDLTFSLVPGLLFLLASVARTTDILTVRLLCHKFILQSMNIAILSFSLVWHSLEILHYFVFIYSKHFMFASATVNGIIL